MRLIFFIYYILAYPRYTTRNDYHGIVPGSILRPLRPDFKLRVTGYGLRVTFFPSRTMGILGVPAFPFLERFRLGAALPFSNVSTSCNSNRRSYRRLRRDFSNRNGECGHIPYDKKFSK